MNKKAAITKELNAKHVKILEGLLKLPENRECADCKSKGPRWASINLGIFICLQCSGIHRSLGVHISKVRSATLDTWLPEQVAFMQSMGNEKSNAYWETELPPHYDRGRIKNFIHAKYIERKWVPRESKVKSQQRSKEELDSARSSTSGSGVSITESTDNQQKEKKTCSAGAKHVADLSSTSSPRSSNVHKDRADNQNQHQRQENGSYQPSAKSVNHVVPDPDPNGSLQKAEPAVLKVQSAAPNAMPVVPSSKVDYATELFRILCIDDSAESDSSPSSDTSTWVDFESDEEASTPKGKVVPKSSASKVHPEPKVKVVQTDLVPLTKGHPQEHQKDAIDDKQSHPEEVHLERLSEIAQGRTALANATDKSSNGSQNYSDSNRQLVVNSCQQPSINGDRVHHTTGTWMPVQNIHPAKSPAIAAPHTISNLYRPAMAINGMSPNPVKRPPAALPVSGYDYDFSFLTQGMFTKRQ